VSRAKIDFEASKYTNFIKGSARDPVKASLQRSPESLAGERRLTVPQSATALAPLGLRSLLE